MSGFFCVSVPPILRVKPTRNFELDAAPVYLLPLLFQSSSFLILLLFYLPEFFIKVLV